MIRRMLKRNRVNACRLRRKRMIKRMLDWIKTKTLIYNGGTFTPVVEKTYQSDVRTKEAIKRVRKAFKAQESAMNARALRAHDSKCPDMLTCKKKKCFKLEPDKIVSDPYVVDRVTKCNDLK